MGQFVKQLGRTRKGNLTAQPQCLRYRPRRPAKLLYQLKSSVQGEKSPAHNRDSGDGFASLSLPLRHGSPCASAVQSISSPVHTLDRLPSRTFHLHVATATLPLTPAAKASPCLQSHRRSPADALPPIPTSRQTSPLRRTQISPSPFLVSFCSPFKLFISFF